MVLHNHQLGLNHGCEWKLCPSYSASTLSLMTLVHHTGNPLTFFFVAQLTLSLQLFFFLVDVVTLRILFPASLLHVSFEFHVTLSSHLLKFFSLLCVNLFHVLSGVVSTTANASFHL
ncbi:unnamed protein product [Brassica oleracea]